MAQSAKPHRHVILIGSAKETPIWVIEIRKEIKRLNQKIRRLDAKEDLTSEEWEDHDNWTGWLRALKWCLKMREGKATRQDAWGRS